MKKGIRAQLYLPKECLDIILDKKEEVEDFFDNFIELGYDIGLGDYNNEEVCFIEVILLQKTTSLVNEDYKRLKWFLKDLTKKQPKQVLCLKFDRV